MNSKIFVFLHFLACLVNVLATHNCDLENMESPDGALCMGNKFCLEYSKMQQLIQSNAECTRRLPILNETNSLFSKEEPTVENKPSCPNVFNQHGRVAERSLAPWTWVKNIDLTRTPVTILETSCLCDYCRNASDLSSLNRDLSAVPIYINVPVRYDNEFGPSLKRISVGCRCDIPTLI